MHITSAVHFERGNRLDTQQKSSEADREGSRRLAEAEVYKGLKIYVITLVVLTAIAWCVVGIRGSILHDPYPRNTLFFKPEARFTDFLDFSARVAHFGEPHVLSRTDIHRYPDPYPYPAASFYAILSFGCLLPLHCGLTSPSCFFFSNFYSLLLN